MRRETVRTLKDIAKTRKIYITYANRDNENAKRKSRDKRRKAVRIRGEAVGALPFFYHYETLCQNFSQRPPPHSNTFSQMNSCENKFQYVFFESWYYANEVLSNTVKVTLFLRFISWKY